MAFAQLTYRESLPLAPRQFVEKNLVAAAIKASPKNAAMARVNHGHDAERASISAEQVLTIHRPFGSSCRADRILGHGLAERICLLDERRDLRLHELRLKLRQFLDVLG